MQKAVLITGGTGSFGKTVVADLLTTDVEEVRVFSRDEEKQDAMRHLLNDDRVRYYIGDVRDGDSVRRAVRGVDAIFHAAALKQVPSCEFFPMEAVKTNVQGSSNVIEAAREFGVGRVVCLSTDKAVFPINAMGMSKALMEKLAQAAARELGDDAATRVACVRYGNVMYSRGSVIPLFIAQVRQGKPLTITEPTMTRFLMPLRDSVALVKFAFEHANQGDLFVKKAPGASMLHLAETIRAMFGVPDHPIDIIGWRHGEKLYETLASAQEVQKSEDLGAYYRIPMDNRGLNYRKFFTEGETGTAAIEDYHSHNTERLDHAGIEALLRSLPEVQAQLAEAGRP